MLSRCLVLVTFFLFASAAPAAPLAFRIDEGNNLNVFTRDGKVAAHLLLRSGKDPRILVAFPAGNSGVGVWFESSQQPVAWTITDDPRPISSPDAKGRMLYGIEAQVAIDARVLDVKRAVLSSVRVLRDFQALGTAPAEVLTPPIVEGKQLVWKRDRLDGAAGYQLSIEALGDAQVSGDVITGRDGKLRLKIRALTGELALTPLEGDSLLTASAAPDQRARNALTFLSYQEKYLAGSWRFDTYFGRDTLMSLRLLAPVLQPTAIESGIGAVLTRLAANGEVAHEEDIGEFAVLRNSREGRGLTDTPIYDYGMVDDDFMLAPVAAHCLLERIQNKVELQKFLSTRNAAGEQQGAALVRNLVWVTERTAAFARDPRWQNLVSIKQGRMTGQWRDSEEGLGRGRYAYDVNAVFVPAALDSIDRLLGSGLLNPHLSGEQRAALQRAKAQAQIWSTKAPPIFEVTVPAQRARASLSTYGQALGLDVAPALAAIGDRPVTFKALSLDATGQPVPVMHSDASFALLFTMPSSTDLDRLVAAMMQPFPAGLLTPIGLLVANPVFAAQEVQARFTSRDYHGTVVWSWQQAVLAAGLDRQLARTDLPASVRERLTKARAELWSVIDATKTLRTSELWSWSYANGTFKVVPFGQQGGHVDESNAAQLWSTVFLARGASE
jgi:hypothetical protein